MLHALRSPLALAIALSSFAAFGDEFDAAVPAPASTSADDYTPSPAELVLQPLQRTILATHPAFSYRFVQVDGVLSAPGQEQDTTVQNFSVGLRWTLGDYVRIQYSPEWTMYSNDAFEDEYGQDATISYQRHFTMWDLGASHRYSRISVPLIETGRQTTQSANSTRLSASRPLGALTSIDLGFTQTIRDASGFSDYRDWSTDNWLNYNWSAAIQFAGGIGYGYSNVPDGTDMSYGRLNARVRWHLTEKIDLEARAGAETRHFIDSGAPDARTPVYGASIRYSPLETTSVSITGERTVYPSYFGGEVHRTNIWGARVSQRLLGRLFLTLSYVWRESSFDSAVVDIGTIRQDRGNAIGVRLATRFRSNGSISIFYNKRTNHSNNGAFDIEGSQYGLEVGLRF